MRERAMGQEWTMRTRAMGLEFTMRKSDGVRVDHEKRAMG